MNTLASDAFKNLSALSEVVFKGVPPNTFGIPYLGTAGQKVTTVISLANMKTPNTSGKCWTDYAQGGAINHRSSTFAADYVTPDINLSLRPLITEESGEMEVETEIAYDLTETVWKLSVLVKDGFGDLTAIVTDESLTKLRVDNVMDLTTPKPYNLIHGQNRFRVAGFNMVLDDEGAVAFIQNALGATFDLVIDEVVSKQLFIAHTAQLLEPGDYKLVVKSRAGDAEGPLQSDFRKVKYLKVEPTPIAIESIGSEGHEGEIVSGTAFAAKGSGLDAFDAEAGDTVKVKWTQGGEDKEATIEPAEVTAAKMSFEFPDALVGVPVDTELTFEITFGETLKTKGATLVDA